MASFSIFAYDSIIFYSMRTFSANLGENEKKNPKKGKLPRPESKCGESTPWRFVVHMELGIGFSIAPEPYLIPLIIYVFTKTLVN